MLDNNQISEILNNTYDFFYDMFSNKSNYYEKIKFEKFQVNPFTIQAAALAFSNTIDPNSIAKAIVYPFTLGTSLSTSFGTKFQEFMVNKVSSTISGSLIDGIDIEYIDALDKRKKYCQLKSGPNTINKDDIKTIEDHFISLTNHANTNHVPINISDFVVGVLYGDENDLSNMYKQIQKDGYNVYAGDDLWYHITGIHGLYHDLIVKAQDAAKNSKMKYSVETLVNKVETGVNKNRKRFGL